MAAITVLNTVVNAKPVATAVAKVTKAPKAARLQAPVPPARSNYNVYWHACGRPGGTTQKAVSNDTWCLASVAAHLKHEGNLQSAVTYDLENICRSYSARYTNIDVVWYTKAEGRNARYFMGKQAKGLPLNPRYQPVDLANVEPLVTEAEFYAWLGVDAPVEAEPAPAPVEVVEMVSLGGTPIIGGTKAKAPVEAEAAPAAEPAPVEAAPVEATAAETPVGGYGLAHGCLDSWLETPVEVYGPPMAPKAAKAARARKAKLAKAA